MITKADDFPIHQRPSPIAEVGSSRNFYDRYFFNGYSKKGDIYFGAALCVYPNLNIMDASFTVAYEDVQHNVRGSRIMNQERLDTKVGPIEVKVLEPLKRLEVIVEDKDMNISARLIFEGYCEALQEPQMHLYDGPRLTMDTCRMVQHGSWSGKININGKEVKFNSNNNVGTRDRSWGIRPVGAYDSQPSVPIQVPQFYWLWNPAHFDDFTTQFHFVDNEDGETVNGLAMMQYKNKNKEEKFSNLSKKVKYKDKSRRVDLLEINAQDSKGDNVNLNITPKKRIFMCGLGYMHQEWGHGHFKGENEKTYDTYNLNEDPHDPPFLHIQSISDITLKRGNESFQGIGVLEELILGPHKTSGFKDLFDR
jgi:hypothetical protein